MSVLRYLWADYVRAPLSGTIIIGLQALASYYLWLGDTHIDRALLLIIQATLLSAMRGTNDEC